MNRFMIEEQLRRFFLEDIGDRDISSDIVIGQEARGVGKIIAKEDGIIAGLNVLSYGYTLLDGAISIRLNKKDSDTIKKGDIVAEIEGPYVSLLSGERVLLNLLQRMSGIATITNEAIRKLGDESIRVCDTRKTTPGLRNLEKYAVRCGGGYNHRHGLHDAVMLKENHLVAGGGITRTVKKLKEKLGHMVKIEVETTCEQEVREAVKAGADVIMFDNASPDEVRRYRELVPNHIITEASGGIALHNIATYRGTGVDYISLGFITHSAKAIDLSFLLEEEEK